MDIIALFKLIKLSSFKTLILSSSLNKSRDKLIQKPPKSKFMSNSWNPSDTRKSSSGITHSADSKYHISADTKVVIRNSLKHGTCLITSRCMKELSHLHAHYEARPLHKRATLKSTTKCNTQLNRLKNTCIFRCSICDKGYTERYNLVVRF